MPCTSTCNPCLPHPFYVCAQMEAATTELSNSLQEESEANSQILQDIYTKVSCCKDKMKHGIVTACAFTSFSMSPRPNLS